MPAACLKASARCGDSLGAPKAAQQDKRLRDWFAATERYATQLHELSEDEYLSMKQRELARQAQR